MPLGPPQLCFLVYHQNQATTSLRTLRVPPALVRRLKPPMFLVILALTGHLRRVGVHAYLEDVRGVCGAIQNSLQKKKGMDVRTGLMVLPFMEKPDSTHDVLATNLALLANVMCIAKA